MNKEGDNELQTLDGNLQMRINEEALELFKQKSSRIAKPYQLLLREIIDAFNEGRLCIVQSEEAKREKEALYK